MSGRVKLAILGGSALATPSLFDGLGRRGAKAAYDAVLLGRDIERLELVRQVSEAIIRAYPGLDIRVSASQRPETALEGADFVINQVRAGGLEGRAFDETFPRQFGIPGEETVGPGGFSSSLRGIPLVLGLCRVIEAVAPQSLVLNLTNPSSIIQYAVRRFTRVNIVGTCDSPISLAESVANLLGVPRGELHIDQAGMHHFGWISKVQRDGVDLLPEVLRRIDELPKLGTDPELVQALGVIPSVYYKYYAHPDRVLAETEGRPIRAHQLMELSEGILAEYRRWQPGDPPDMLAKRGAAWYEKIVVPALLAFAEEGTTELVLSVDNLGILPYLPDEAIVEAPVSIAGGKIAGRRGAYLPQSVQAMLVQNCAYEMQAAEAIAEGDHAKALRALMSNLLVTTFNQARGILGLVWPGEPQS